MPSRTVRSEAGERAQFDLRVVVGDHSRRRRTIQASRSRIFTSDPSPEDRATQLTIALLVAITENYSATALLQIAGTTSADVKSWQTQQRAWLNRGGVDLDACPSYLAFRGWNEARNAIMHGNGELTEMQRTASWAQDVITRLAAAGVRVRRSVIFLSTDDLERCAQTCHAFVGELDDAARGAVASVPTP